MENKTKKQLDTFEVIDDGRVISIPCYHKPGTDGCRCITCLLAANEITVDFYKGYILGQYVQSLVDGVKPNAEVHLFFTDKEIENFIAEF